VVYVATALVRQEGSWSAREVDLSDVEDLDGAADLLRDLLDEADDGPALLFVDENDEWVGIVRVDGPDDEPRAFLSDTRVVSTSDLAGSLFADVPPALPELDDDDEETIRPEAEPGGEADIMADFGTPSGTLLELCAEEGMLPSDVIAAVCEKAGCLEPLEELREALS
jgi:putative tRNA adenosine deaminase-associated protein